MWLQLPPRNNSARSSLVVGLVAFGLASIWAVNVLAGAEWDPSVFAAFGEEAAPTREYAEDRLGPVSLRPRQGHDGKFFFVQANDPWLIDPEDNAAVLDLPLYRSQRMFYPVLAGGAGLFEPRAVLWGMLAVNLIALGAGATGVGAIAREMGGSAWWGMAFVFNLGFFSEVVIGGGGVLAGALAFWAVALILRGRLLLAIAMFTLAALSREVMLVAPMGAAMWLWRRGARWDAARTVALPSAAVAAWWLYLRFRLGFESGVSEIQGLGPPLAGFIEAFETWLGDPFDLLVGATILGLLVLYTIRALRSPSVLGWTFLGFVPLTLVLNDLVWNNYFDITRAVAPLITAYVLLVVLSDGGKGPRFSVRPTASRSADPAHR